MAKVPRTCGNCKYCVHESCYYNPPTAVVDMSCWKLVAAHPPVEPDDRCSKWEVNPRIERES